MSYWTTRGVEVPVEFNDVLDGRVDVDACERVLGVGEATPILIDSVGRIDPRLARFVRRSRFTFLAEGTRQSYVKDHRRFFSFLWRRGKYWDQPITTTSAATKRGDDGRWTPWARRTAR